MENKLKLNKYLYKGLMKVGCSHFLDAYNQNLLDISEDNNFDNENFSDSGYFDMMDAFANENNEIPDAIKFFLMLKGKVLNYYKEIYKNQLKDYHENFQLVIDDCFLTLDFFRIDHKKKEIKFIIIKPSTINSNNKHFIKTWDQPKKSHKWFKEYLETETYNKHQHFFEKAWRPFAKSKEELDNVLLIPETWKSSKRGQAYELLFIMQKLHHKYSKYKIIATLPLIKKTKKPFSFEELSYVINPEEEKNIEAYKAIFKRNDDLINNCFSDSKSNLNLPQYQPKFPTNKKCFICNIEKSELKIKQDYREGLVESILINYPDKIAMFDFETINDPLPDTDFYYPYDKIVVQISIHLLDKGEIVDHKEYIVKDLSKSELSVIYNMLVEVVKQEYKLCAYYRAFEGTSIATMERVLNRNDISLKYNLTKEQRELGQKNKLEILDLMDFFNKRKKEVPISLERFGPSSSIKNTIEFYAGNQNPYKELTINNGFKAMKKLYELIVEKSKKQDKEVTNQLYKYCKQDTLTMVNLYNKIREVRKMIQLNPKEKEKILNELDKK